MIRRLMLACLASAPLPALANDSVAELGTGGLVLSRSDVIAMDDGVAGSNPATPTRISMA